MVNKTTLDNLLLEIRIDVQNELVRQLSKCTNIDNEQFDCINENVTGVISMNKRKYIDMILNSGLIKQIGQL